MMRSVFEGARSIGLVIMILCTAAYAHAVNFSKTIYWYVNGEKQEYQFDEHQMILSAKPEALEHIQSYKQLEMLDIELYDGTELAYIDPADMLDIEGDILMPVYAFGSTEPILLDDKVMVTFKNADITAEEVNAFANTYGLRWVNTDVMNLPRGGNYTYIFELDGLTPVMNAATLSAELYEQRQDLVLSAQPNRVNHAHVDGDAVVDNPSFQKSWHLKNEGQSLFCTQNSGNNGADIHAVEAWDMGYTGQGVKVAVIDIGGFDMDHPDMQGQFMMGWDCIANNAYGPGNSYFVDPNLAHGMAVAGIIGAKGNDLGATGVAYNAQILPLLINGSESSILIALQKALELDVDIINMSPGTPIIESARNTSGSRNRSSTRR